jgi:hypothetical protein
VAGEGAELNRRVTVVIETPAGMNATTVAVISGQ